jgi:type I restriction enzyme S subunit
MLCLDKKKWVETDLNNVFWFQEGPGVRNWQFTTSGIKLLNVANITKTGNIDLSKTDRCLSVEEVHQKYSHFLVDAGDLVIASSGISFDTDSLLRTRGAFVDSSHLPLCMNTSTIRFKAKEGVSDLEFLRFWLDSFEFRDQVTRLVTGSAQQNFGPSHLKQIKITLPPLEEQKRIAAIARKCDRLRRTRRFTQQISDTYLRTTFLQIFEDYLYDYPSTLLGEIVTITGGGTPSRDIPEYFQGNIPWLTSKDMRGEYIFDTQEHITEEAIRKSATKLVPKESILMVVKSKVLMHRLPLAISKVDICHGQDIKSIQCSAKLNLYFLMHLLKHYEKHLLRQFK